MELPATKSPATPIPPATFSAPVVLLVAAMVPVIVTLPANTLLVILVADIEPATAKFPERLVKLLLTNVTIFPKEAL